MFLGFLECSTDGSIDEQDPRKSVIHYLPWTCGGDTHVSTLYNPYCVCGGGGGADMGICTLSARGYLL